MNSSGLYIKQAAAGSPWNDFDVILESNDLMLTYDFPYPPAAEFSNYSLVLSENDWQNQTTASALGKDDFLAVLANLKNLRIRGEYHDGADSSCYDNVLFSSKQ